MLLLQADVTANTAEHKALLKRFRLFGPPALREAVSAFVDEDVQRAAATARRQAVERPPIDIAPNDPLLAYFAESRGAVSLDELQLESPAVQALRARGSKLVVPLISQGELIGAVAPSPDAASSAAWPRPVCAATPAPGAGSSLPQP